MSNKFEWSVWLGMFVAWVQIMLGYNAHAFYVLGGFVIIILIGIMRYLREISFRIK